MNKFNLANPSIRIAIIAFILVLVGVLGFAIGYIVRGDTGPASIVIEKCSTR